MFANSVMFLLVIGSFGCAQIIIKIHDQEEPAEKEIKLVQITSPSDLDFRVESVRLHNLYRLNHADTLPLLSKLELIHSAIDRCRMFATSVQLTESIGQPADLSENVWIGRGNNSFTIGDAINAWYGEMAHYNYLYPGWLEETSHFTKMIWRNSAAMGCARCVTTLSNDNNVDGGRCRHCYQTVFVCHYTPGGNLIGQFSENVRPFKTDCQHK